MVRGVCLGCRSVLVVVMAIRVVVAPFEVVAVVSDKVVVPFAGGRRGCGGRRASVVVTVVVMFAVFVLVAVLVVVVAS